MVEEIGGKVNFGIGQNITDRDLDLTDPSDSKEFADHLRKQAAQLEARQIEPQLQEELRAQAELETVRRVCLPNVPCKPIFHVSDAADTRYILGEIYSESELQATHTFCADMDECFGELLDHAGGGKLTPFDPETLQEVLLPIIVSSDGKFPKWVRSVVEGKNPDKVLGQKEVRSGGENTVGCKEKSKKANEQHEKENSLLGKTAASAFPPSNLVTAEADHMALIPGQHVEEYQKHLEALRSDVITNLLKDVTRVVRKTCGGEFQEWNLGV